MTLTRRDWKAMIVGWTLGCVVGGGVYWFNVNLFAAIPVLLACTTLATFALLPRRS